jgi:hypothetical protein
MKVIEGLVMEEEEDQEVEMMIIDEVIRDSIAEFDNATPTHTPGGHPVSPGKNSKGTSSKFCPFSAESFFSVKNMDVTLDYTIGKKLGEGKISLSVRELWRG